MPLPEQTITGDIWNPFTWVVEGQVVFLLVLVLIGFIIFVMPIITGQRGSRR